MVESRCSDAIWNVLWFFTGGILIAAVYFVAGLLFGLTWWYWDRASDCMQLAYNALGPFGAEWKYVRVYNETLDEPDTASEVVVHIMWYPFMITLFTLHLVLGIALAAIVVGIPIAKVHYAFTSNLLRPLRKNELFWCCHCCP
jgi:uncharacterized membrane protein YccF (DUF307 family)